MKTITKLATLLLCLNIFNNAYSQDLLTLEFSDLVIHNSPPMNETILFLWINNIETLMPADTLSIWRLAKDNVSEQDYNFFIINTFNSYNNTTGELTLDVFYCTYGVDEYINIDFTNPSSVASITNDWNQWLNTSYIINNQFSVTKSIQRTITIPIQEDLCEPSNAIEYDMALFGPDYTCTLSFGFSFYSPNSGIEDIHNTKGISPNPFNVSLLNPEKKNIEIYDLSGHLLIKSSNRLIDTSNLPSGVYVANINGVRQKIIKSSL